MALTIANWTISVRLHHAAPTRRVVDALTRTYRRHQLDNEIARTREQAHTEWLLMGGNVNH